MAWLFDRWGDLFQSSVFAGVLALLPALLLVLIIVQIALIVTRSTLVVGAGAALLFPRQAKIAALIVAALLVALTFHP